MGTFQFTETKLHGLFLIDVKAYGDSCGSFMETYKQPDFRAAGIDCDFVQDNQSSPAAASSRCRPGGTRCGAFSAHRDFCPDTLTDLTKQGVTDPCLTD